jgi:rhamnogalacturonan endolyase
MRPFLPNFRCGHLVALLLPLVWFWMNAAAADPVTLREDARSFTLANGLVTAKIEKASGDLVSLRYQGLELMASGRGSMGGYWSSVGRTRPGGEHTAVVRVNPATNGGTLAEISCRTANVAGAPDAPLDIDIRYALIPGEPGIFTYCEWTHHAGYPPFSVGEARYCLKLNPAIFDFLTVDENRRRVMPSGADWDRGAPTNLKEARLMTTGVHKGEVEHKYDYSAVFSETPAYGWSSTRHNVGLWIINPSLEYLGGGPTKAELTGHLDVNPGGTPTLLNMWLGSHYGGTAFSVARDESWSKFIGPFLIYCNAARPGASVDATQRVLWQEALARARAEEARWPYGWLVDSNYPRAWDRGAVSGQLVLHDPHDAAATMSNVWVGVTAPDFAPSFSGFGGGWRGGTNRFGRAGAPNAFAGGAIGRTGFPALQDWQRDAKHYQFWVRADAAGRFVIPNVRPGNYWLRAIADGVIGEFTLTNVAVNAGIITALGRQTWQPVRYGRTVWQIGVPDRTAREFRHGDDYWHWGLYFKYVDEFPHDVNFVIGKSNWRTDWNYVQPPRIMHRTDIPVESEEDEAADAEARRRDPRDGVQSSVWSIRFDLTNAPAGRATLRLAFCGTHQGCDVEVLVNGQAAGDTGPLPSTSTMQRDGIRAFWIEKPIAFDAALLKAGENLIQLRSRANTWSQGVLYDCVRLELQP